MSLTAVATTNRLPDLSTVPAVDESAADLVGLTAARIDELLPQIDEDYSTWQMPW